MQVMGSRARSGDRGQNNAGPRTRAPLGWRLTRFRADGARMALLWGGVTAIGLVQLMLHWQEIGAAGRPAAVLAQIAMSGSLGVLCARYLNRYQGLPEVVTGALCVVAAALPWAALSCGLLADRALVVGAVLACLVVGTGTFVLRSVFHRLPMLPRPALPLAGLGLVCAGVAPLCPTSWAAMAAPAATCVIATFWLVARPQARQAAARASFRLAFLLTAHATVVATWGASL